MARGVAMTPEITYQEAETLLENENALNAAFDILFDEVLKRRLELSPDATSIPMTSVYN